jgi:DNA repair protein RecO (recombination protein O)
MPDGFATVRALVLRSVTYKESSRILTVLTDTHGKITVSAQGAVRKNSRVAPAVQPLTFSEMTLSHNRDRWTLTEAHVIEQFRELTEQLDRFALGSYVLELLENVADEDSPNPEILSLGLRTLFALGEGRRSVQLVKAAFELRLMCLAGFTPTLDAARLETLGGVRLDNDARAAVRHVVTCDARRVFSFALADETRFVSAAEGYVLEKLERGFKTLDYYHQTKGL